MKEDAAVICNPMKFFHEKMYVGSNNPTHTIRPFRLDLMEPATDNVSGSFFSNNHATLQFKKRPRMSEPNKTKRKRYEPQCSKSPGLKCMDSMDVPTTVINAL